MSLSVSVCIGLLMNEAPSPADTVEIDGIGIAHSSIYDVVSTFYRKVPHDPLLKEPFSDVEDWPHHIHLMTHFWWIRLGGERYLDYSYNPIPKHFEKGFNEKRLSRWLQLFDETLRESLTQEQSKKWLEVAHSIGSFLAKRNAELSIQKADSKSSYIEYNEK